MCFLWQEWGGGNANAHTRREKPVGFTAGHTAATNAQHKELYRRDVMAETFRRRKVQYDQSHTLRWIDCARQMKHFTIRWFISPPDFQRKSMVIKLYQQRFVFFSFLLGLATVYAMLFLQCKSFYMSNFWQSSVKEKIGRVGLQWKNILIIH